MKIPRPRLTVRRLMIVVALAGMGLGGAATLRRRAEFARARASHHSTATFEGIGGSTSAADFERAIKRVKYHLEREGRWRAAAARPWLPVLPDPPAPE